MWRELSSVIAEGLVGLLVAGVIVALLVPAVGAAMEPRGAFALGLACVLGAIAIGRRWRRGRDRTAR